MVPSLLNPDWKRLTVCAGYPAVYCPEHPKSWSTGYIHAHVLIAERKIGRFLNHNECVHHVDEDKFNFEPSNLEIKNKSDHARDHQPSQNFVTQTCDHCGGNFERRKGAESKLKGYSRTFCNRECYHESLRS